MSKIMELADAYASGLENYARGDKYDIRFRDALAAEVEKLEAEIVRLQHEVVNRNQRALDGDQAKSAFNSMYDKAEALREKLAIAQTANNLFDKALLAAHPQGAEGVVYEYWNEARKFMEATK